MALTHELGRSWGHEGTKVPAWYDGFGCLVPFDLRSFGLGRPCQRTCWHEACHCLVPCGLELLGLGGALLPVACFSSLLVACPLSGVAAVMVLATSLLVGMQFVEARLDICG